MLVHPTRQAVFSLALYPELTIFKYFCIVFCIVSKSSRPRCILLSFVSVQGGGYLLDSAERH